MAAFFSFAGCDVASAPPRPRSNSAAQTAPSAQPASPVLVRTRQGAICSACYLDRPRANTGPTTMPVPNPATRPPIPCPFAQCRPPPLPTAADRPSRLHPRSTASRNSQSHQARALRLRCCVPRVAVFRVHAHRWSSLRCAFQDTLGLGDRDPDSPADDSSSLRHGPFVRVWLAHAR
ncbi:hypothetical protein AcV7_008971 [Taiwanofungus camphoratus]|nr:hypothetical protein AcV7_008971 [Antrodia cinnamomea]